MPMCSARSSSATSTACSNTARASRSKRRPGAAPLTLAGGTVPAVLHSVASGSAVGGGAAVGACQSAAVLPDGAGNAAARSQVGTALRAKPAPVLAAAGAAAALTLVAYRRRRMRQPTAPDRFGRRWA